MSNFAERLKEQPCTIFYPSGSSGYGQNVTGGEGGTVYTVTNTDDSGSGSFREAVGQSGTRIVNFQSSLTGEIVLTTNLQITNSNITIDGIGSDVVIRPQGQLSFLNASQAIFRNLIIRGHQSQNENDCISITNSTNVIIEYCSLYWAGDEIIGINDGQNVEVGYCILAESAPIPSGKGMLITNGSRRILVHHNLFAHNATRNPNAQGDGDMEGEDALHDIVNNVIYNAGTMTQVQNAAKANIRNNYYKLGPNSTYPSPREIVRASYVYGRGIYATGNIGPSNGVLTNDNWLTGMISTSSGLVSKDDRSRSLYCMQPSQIETQDAITARDLVLTNAGSPINDVEDQRIRNEFNNGTGAWIITAPY